MPVELAELIDPQLQRLGYSSRTEFVKDAVRQLLRAYGVVTDELPSQHQQNATHR